jgi:threonine/homoserine/homoserine lactone efflux protein
MVWLGIKLWRAGGSMNAQPRGNGTSRARMLGHAWLVTALNPKSIIFFVAFLPQFLNPKGDFFAQMAIFEITFLVLAFTNALGYALAASRARAAIRNDRMISIANKAGGTLLIGAGIATITVRAGN